MKKKKKKKTRAEIREGKIQIDFSNYTETDAEDAADRAFVSVLSLDNSDIVSEEDYFKLLKSLK